MGSSYFNDILDTIEKASNKKIDLILLGDLNSDYVVNDETMDNNFDSAAFWHRVREKANACPKTQQHSSMISARQNGHYYC